MRVTNIDIANLHFNDGLGCHEGYVTMALQSTRSTSPVLAQFLCHAAQAEACPGSTVTHDLIADALRQAHRMPGFRRGERTIELAVSRARIAPPLASA